MKKIYQIPETNVLRVETQQMIAESMVVDGSKTIEDANQILSREHGSVWDDEEDY